MKKILFNTLILFLCIVGAILNIFINKLAAGIIFLPLYLDTIFTITSTLLGGLFWGSLTGALTGIIGQTYYFWGWEPYLFIICSVATAFLTWSFMRYFPDELRGTLYNKKNLDRGQEIQFKYKFAKSQQLDKVINLVFVL